MNFIEFDTESTEYRQALELRQKILRAPLGLDIYKEDLSLEKEQLHFGLLNKDLLIACVTVIPESADLAKVRQMAVSDDFQGKGLGALLFENCLKTLGQKGFNTVILNARKSAVGFYEKFGFTICSEEFIEVTIPHVKMKKDL